MTIAASTKVAAEISTSCASAISPVNESRSGSPRSTATSAEVSTTTGPQTRRRSSRSLAARATAVVMLSPVTRQPPISAVTFDAAVHEDRRR